MAAVGREGGGEATGIPGVVVAPKRAGNTGVPGVVVEPKNVANAPIPGTVLAGKGGEKK